MCINHQEINPNCPPLWQRGARGDLQHGVSMIELIMFIVIISIAVAGILLVMNKVTGHSADTLVRKQALAIGESLLEEIELQSMSGVGCVGTLGVNVARTAATTVCDYNGYSTTGGIRDFSTNAVVSGLTGYDVTAVTVVPTAAAWGAIPAGSAVVITVSVTGPGGVTGPGQIDLTGYRAGQ
jgi:MSHA pilin protein MshD